MFDWGDLRVLLAVHRTGSVRAAATAIGTTHATVSRHVRRLESALGGTILQRIDGRQHLSALGKRVLPLAEGMEESASAIDRLAFSEEKGIAGPVRLSISETLFLSLLKAPIQEFAARYPMVEVELSGTDRHSSLSRREADVAIRLTKTPPDAAIGRRIAESPLAAFVAPEYMSNRPGLDRWIALEYEAARQPILPARQAALIDSPQLAQEFLAAGLGIGLLPCYMGDMDDRLVRFPGFDPVPDLSLWVLTHGDLRENPRVRALMDHLYSALRDLKPLIEGMRPRRLVQPT